MINQENPDLYDLNDALKVENLTLHDYEEICKRLKRKPNRTELGMFGVMSVSYTHLTLPTSHCV